jgi:ABC-type hemin transport system ATPase subunit
LSELLDVLTARLRADPALEARIRDLVLAAFLGDDEFAAFLEEGTAPLPPEVDTEALAPVGAFLSSITLEGFRGIGPEATLPVEPGPGLVLVVGRNGSGKSSFAEGLELLLTGENQRWASRASMWREGWRNLHHSDTCSIKAGLAIESHRGGAVVQRVWAPDADLEASIATVQLHGQRKAPFTTLGWGPGLVTYRPFLSYNELGSMLEEGPSRLFDALTAILGLEELVTTEARLRAARLERERAIKALKSHTVSTRDALASSRDERASRCVEALHASPADMAAIEAVLSGEPTSGDGDPDSDQGILNALAALPVPTIEQVQEHAALLQAAGDALRALEDTDTARAQALASLLEQALAWHSHDDNSNCPVCGTAGVLDATWHRNTELEVARLREQAAGAAETIRIASEARQMVRALVSAPPEVLDRAASVGLDARRVINTWQTWAKLPTEDDGALTTHLESAAPPLLDAVAELRGVALQRLAEHQDAWRPCAESLASWLTAARTAQSAATSLPPLTQAEAWVKQTTAQLRAERFTPIRDQAQGHWRTLSRGGSVALDDIRLEGAATRRHVQLDVTVDGIEGAALGVMSQGELHSLALSLFLPRAMLPESPFRFILIDDPVQAMDPARVDGLALVLQNVAHARQVLVFTHDDRLPEAVRRLRVDAAIVEVTRRPDSVVELRPALDPVERALSDARAVAKSERLPSAVARRVVPGLCRQALEAACTEVIRRRRLTRGAAHEEVELALEQADRLTERMALALFDDMARGGDVLSRLNGYGRWAGDTFIWCNKGAHGNATLDAEDLVKSTEHLAAKVRAQ